MPIWHLLSIRAWVREQQTVKELVDNAIDACRWRSADQDAPTIRVVLRRLPAVQRDSEEGDRANDENKTKGTLQYRLSGMLLVQNTTN